MFSINTCFPKTDRALLKWKSSKLDVRTSIVSTINSVVSSQLLCYLLPQSLKTLIASTWQYSLQHLPRQEHINWRFQPADTTLVSGVCGVCTAKLLRRDYKNGATVEQVH
jgi:hypothetical protein